VPARFILSLDCEGKWGVADHQTARHRGELSDQRLRDAYRSIVALLDEFGMPATFAFVGAFTQSRSAFAKLRPAIEQLSRNAPDYLGPALRDLGETGAAGWHGGDLVELVEQANAGHEIALHGVTHVPWTDLNDTAARAELDLLQQLEGPIRRSKTFVYPRNLVAHTELLASHGFKGYRTARTRSRLSSLLSEFNVFEAPEQAEAPNGIVPIPAGFFLNWRSGARRLVPPQVTAARARRLLHAAGLNDGVVHYWLHPENIASAPATLDLLKLLLREVSAAREVGRCEVMTQVGYCRWAKSLH
jgi:peptidoglycan/xylan/chitin deacetylase (PgdA/CDA1 family)